MPKIFNGNIVNQYGFITEHTVKTRESLIIVFKDILDPSEAKAVPNLTVRADYSNNVDVLVAANTDSIAIPLRTGADDTRFQFINENEDGTFTNIASRLGNYCIFL